jgi:O-antigen/teichoic acid export membrane protein
MIALPSTVSLFVARAMGVGLSALGGIWAARVLGPEKLGISTFVMAFVGLAGTLTNLNQNYSFVRRGKSMPDSDQLNYLIGNVCSLRLGLGLTMAAVAIFAAAILRVEPTWHLAIAAGVIMALAQSNDAGWVLQLRERMPWLFIAFSLQSGIGGILCITLIRADWPAGSDLLMGAVGSIASFTFAWWFACDAWPPGFRLSLRGAFAGLRLIKEGRWLALMSIGTFIHSTAELPLIGYFANVEELGIYRTALQLVNVLNPFIPLLFYNLYPRLIELQKSAPQHVVAAQFSALQRVGFFGTPLVVSGFVLAPFVYPVIFGQEFAEAALPFAFLLAAKVVSVGSNIFMWGSFARHLDRIVVLFTLAVACLSLVLNILLIPLAGLVAAAIVNCSVQCLLLLAYVLIAIYSPAENYPAVDQ